MKQITKRYEISDFYFSLVCLIIYVAGVVTSIEQHGFVNSVLIFSFWLLPILLMPGFSREERILGRWQSRKK